jgi:hypothetical protein
MIMLLIGYGYAWDWNQVLHHNRKEFLRKKRHSQEMVHHNTILDVWDSADSTVTR